MNHILKLHFDTNERLKYEENIFNLCRYTSSGFRNYRNFPSYFTHHTLCFVGRHLLWKQQSTLISQAKEHQIFWAVHRPLQQRYGSTQGCKDQVFSVPMAYATSFRLSYQNPTHVPHISPGRYWGNDTHSVIKTKNPYRKGILDSLLVQIGDGKPRIFFHQIH